MIRVSVLGATTVEVDGRVLPDGSLRGRPRQVLEILALAAGAPVAKERLAHLIWDGAPPASQQGTLESYVCLLRRCLGVRSGRDSVLGTSNRGYQLVTPAVSVDLVEFRGLTREAAEASATSSVALTLQALGRVHGGLLESEPFADWAEQARELFDREAVAAFTHAAGLANGIRQFENATRLARAALRHDRFCETAWQHLIRSYWLSGRHSEALRAYGELRQLLIGELGDEPSRESQDLYEAVLQASVCGDHQPDFDELETLMRLLRQSLEATPGATVPGRDSGLSAAAVRVLAASR